jgi:hypothetical protein
MASNKDLAARARELGRELGEEVETAGLNNAKLVELVATLEERLAAKPGAPGAEVTAGDDTEDEDAAEIEIEEPEAPEKPEQPKAAVVETPAVAPEAKAPVFRVAPGKAVATLSRDVQGPGAEVTAGDFPQGDKRLEQLLAAGYLVKR